MPRRVTKAKLAQQVEYLEGALTDLQRRHGDLHLKMAELFKALDAAEIDRKRGWDAYNGKHDEWSKALYDSQKIAKAFLRIPRLIRWIFGAYL